jgi:hypothetical protein
MSYKLQSQVYERHLLKNTFKLLFRLKEYLQQENCIVEQHQMRVVAKFRFVRLTGRVLKVLSEHKDISRTERHKNEYKDQIRGKVSQWLSDFEEGKDADASNKERLDSSALNQTFEGPTGDRIKTTFGIFANNIHSTQSTDEKDTSPTHVSQREVPAFEEALHIRY